MATEGSSGVEFQEKTGLKRKLTGPPRLLLGKTRSPVQQEKKSRKHRLQNNVDNDTMTTKNEQSTELLDLKSPGNPETILSTQPDGGTCMDLQEERLETASNSGQDMTKRWKRSKAGATIRRIFSCVRTRKELRTKAAQDAEENKQNAAHNSIRDEELFTRSGDSIKTRHEQDLVKISARRFHVRMWRVFEKRSSKGIGKREEHGAGQCNDTYTETSVNLCMSGAAEPPAVNKSSENDGNVSGTCKEENCLESRDSKKEVMEMVSLSASNFPCLINEEEPKIQISEAPLTGATESNSDPDDPRMTPGDPVRDEMLVDVPHAFRCKPVIMIEDIQSSDEESDDLFESPSPRYDTLSPLVLLNGSRHPLKTSESRFSEILLAQTALALVRAAVSSAVEQVSAELRMDQDHV